MRWIDKTFYDDSTNGYGGEPITDEATFESLANPAERLIDRLTRFQLSQADFNSLDMFRQNQVKMAICAQIEYFNDLGVSTEAKMKMVQNASIGGFSFTLANGEKLGMVSQEAITYLSASGFMYAGVRTEGNEDPAPLFATDYYLWSDEDW